MGDVSPAEMAEIVGRLEVRPGAPVDVELAPDIAADAKPGLRPRSVKLSDELDARCQIRAGELGLSKSAYIRQLIEADLRAAYSGEPEMVPLEAAQLAASRAVAEALERLSHRGHAA
jgi:predicted transcriptional regulator